jgi:hypothetical protein
LALLGNMGFQCVGLNMGRFRKKLQAVLPNSERARQILKKHAEIETEATFSTVKFNPDFTYYIRTEHTKSGLACKVSGYVSCVGCQVGSAASQKAQVEPSCGDTKPADTR